MGYEKGNKGLGFVLLVYATSRLFYLVAGALFAIIVPVGRFQRVTSDVPFGTMNLWSHWDGEHYVALAAGGYLQSPDNVSPAFFPLYPLLMRSFAELFGGPLSLGTLSLWGVLISLLALPFALYFIYHIALEGWGEQTARVAILTLAFFPTTFFLNSAYTESLFLALSAASVWAVRVRKDLLLACALAAFAAATRNVGLFLVVPLAYEWLRGGAGREFGWWRAAACLALAPSGLFWYAIYLWLRSGNLFLFYSAQSYWSRKPTDPLTFVTGVFTEAYEGLTGLFRPQPLADTVLEDLMGRLNGTTDAYNLLFLLFAVALLLFIVLAVLLENRRILAFWLVLSAILSLVFCAEFVSWRFVA